MRLLLVEDSVGAVIGKVLEKHGYEVILAETAEKAKAAMERHEIDFFLIDWMLPGMSGLELVQHTRALTQYSTTPIVMISGRRREEDISAAMASGIDDYMAKPFTAIQLRRKIEEVCRKLDGSEARERQIAAIMAGSLTFDRACADPFVLMVCGSADAASLREGDPRIVAGLDVITRAIARTNDSHRDLRLGYHIVPSTVDAVALLRSWPVRRRIRMLVVSSGAKGNPVLLARLLSHRSDTDIPVIILCEHQGDIPMEHRVQFEMSDFTVMERTQLTPQLWDELLDSAVGDQ